MLAVFQLLQFGHHSSSHLHIPACKRDNCRSLAGVIQPTSAAHSYTQLILSVSTLDTGCAPIYLHADDTQVYSFCSSSKSAVRFLTRTFHNGLCVSIEYSLFACGVRSARERSFKKARGETDTGRRRLPPGYRRDCSWRWRRGHAPPAGKPNPS